MECLFVNGKAFLFMNFTEKIFFLACFLLNSFSSQGQFLEDTKSKELVSSGLRKVYNLEIKPAQQILQPVIDKYADHPVSYLIKSLLLQQEFIPIESNTAKLNLYLQNLKKCIELATELEKKDVYKAEATFYLLASYGLIAEIYHNKKSYLVAANEGRKAYQFLRDGFELKSVNPEFYFTSGVYDFYRERYPQTHPEIKPIIVFFKKGNEERGIDYLRTATKKAIFTNVESRIFLMGILLKYKNECYEANKLGEGLVNEFPRNSEFRMRYTETLLAIGKYELASDQLTKLTGSGVLFETSRNLFNGLIFEKKDGNFDQALIHFAKSIKSNDKGRYIKDYKSMAYLGMGRIFLKQNNFAKAELFLKESLKIAEYPAVIKEANELMLKLK